MVRVDRRIVEFGSSATPEELHTHEEKPQACAYPPWDAGHTHGWERQRAGRVAVFSSPESKTRNVPAPGAGPATRSQE